MLILLLSCLSEDRTTSKYDDDRAFDESDDGHGTADTGDADDADADVDSDADGDADADSDVDTGEVADTGEPDDTGDTDTGEDACDDASPVTLYVSPDDSNSQSAAVLARIAVLEGWGDISRLPNRTHEFMNYYDFDYPAADPGSLRITPSMVASEDGTWSLQVGISSPAVTNDTRDPLNLVLSIDTSCSMTNQGADATGWTFGAIAASLREGDRVSAIQWAADAIVLLEDHEVTGPNDPEVLAVVPELTYAGKTDLAQGLDLAYELAERHHDDSVISRVLVISDGGTNVGETDAKTIARYTAEEFGRGIYMGVVGVGTEGYYKDEILDTISDLGKGSSAFVDSEAEAVRTFGSDRFVQMFDVAAKDVRIEMILPPGFEFLRTTAEEVSENPDEVEPQNLAPDDSIVLHNVITTCAPEDVTDASTIVLTVSWKDPITAAEKTVSGTYTFGELLAQDSGLLQKGAAIYAYAETLQMYKDRGADVDSAIERALDTVGKAQEKLPGDADLAEVRSILEAL